MNNKISVLLMLALSFLISCADNPTNPEVTKIPTVTVGGKNWMINNIDIQYYKNGDSIPEVKDEKVWSTLTTGAWCYYNNDSTNGPIYGKLYNWYAINDPRGFAPTGWHVATDDEWNFLINYIGGPDVAGGKLKENGTLHWNTPNTGATNEIGFNALPCGWRDFNGKFSSLGDYCGWWSSTSEVGKPSFARLRHIVNNTAIITNNYYDKSAGFSIRLIKD